MKNTLPYNTIQIVFSVIFSNDKRTARITLLKGVKLNYIKTKMIKFDQLTLHESFIKLLEPELPPQI